MSIIATHSEEEPTGLVALREVVSRNTEVIGRLRDSSKKPAASQTSILRVVSLRAAEVMQ